MKSTNLLYSMAGCLLLSCTAQAASPIPGVFSTGVNALGNPLPVGAVDPHWVMSGSPSGPGAALAMPPFFLWTGNTPTSAWINGTATDADLPLGVYTYSLSFSLAGFDPSTAMISGQWVSDNYSTIYLNGVDTGFTHTTPYEFVTFNNFALTTGFLPGTNTLTFSVTQVFGTGQNPEGLQVNITSATASVVPEPGFLALASISTLVWMSLRCMRNGKREN